MGKYIRKAKARGGVAVMEVSQSSLGVRTRAKTLALQRLQKSLTPAAVSPAGSVSYLELRSRRLEKPLIALPSHDSRRQRQTQRVVPPHVQTERPKTGVGSEVKIHELDSESSAAVSLERVEEDGQRSDVAVKETVCKLNEIEGEMGDNEKGDFGSVEASCGENVLDCEGTESSTRESTPCSLIRDPCDVRTPESSTRPTVSHETIGKFKNTSQRRIPTTIEMDEFFTGAEEELQRQFIEKYNFDPVTEKPLPGRYEWEKLE